VAGNVAVWQDFSVGNGDIYAYWFDGAPAPFVVGVPGAVATGPAPQIHPDVDGSLVVYEGVGGSLPGDRRIYLYDFTSTATVPITTDAAEPRQPRISGNLIVWEDHRQGNADLYGCRFDTVALRCGPEQGLVAGPETESLHAVEARPDGGYDIAYTVAGGTADSDIRVLRVMVEPDPSPTPSPTPAPTPTPTPSPTPTPPPPSGDPCDSGSGAPEYFLETFEGGRNGPLRVRRSFAAVRGPGTICLTLDHVRRARVRLNGAAMFGSGHFPPNAASARAEVRLRHRNRLEVQLAGPHCRGDGDHDHHGGGRCYRGRRRHGGGHKHDLCPRMTVRIVGAVPPEVEAGGPDGRQQGAGRPSRE
jgi:beta propeller repeat protein